MSDILNSLGARRVTETLSEALVPMGLSLGSVYLVRQLLADPTPARPWSPLEVASVLGGVMAVTGWYAGRQAQILGIRNPFRVLQVAALFGAMAIGILAYSARGSFDARCEALKGRVIRGEVRRVCLVGGVVDNPYLPGTYLRASWEAQPSLPLGLWLTGVLGLSALGMRSRRLVPTRLASYVSEQLRLAPAAGPNAVYGGLGESGEIQACANATLWGELCAQTYPAEREFAPGEWCIRCAQTYNRASRTLDFTVVSLFSGDIETLNALERMDTVVWTQGEPMPPDARLSGTERWIELGRVTVPDVITVTTLLAHVSAHVERWMASSDARIAQAATLASQRASRVSAWVWFDGKGRGLTYARPSEDASLVLGSSRLRDLALDVGEDLVLQLDIGLIPLELRTGFRQTFLDPGRDPIVQNSKQDLWVPTNNPAAQRDGVWVPRIEGAAIRAWLELDRLRPADALGVVSPLPYAIDGSLDDVQPRPVDLIQAPLRAGIPVIERHHGDSLSEWTWLPWRQIESLRRNCLLMVDE